MKPMLAERAEKLTTPLSTLLTSDVTAVEQKLDGMRCVADYRDYGVKFYGRNGQIIKSTAVAPFLPRLAGGLLKVAEALGADDVRFALDGELVVNGDSDGSMTYFVFDLIEYGQSFDGGLYEFTVTANTAMVRRRRALVDLFAAHAGLFAAAGVNLVYQARTAEEKLKLFNDVLAANGEGVIVKNLTAGYTPDARSTAWIKIKFWRTADCYVTTLREEGKESATLAVTDERGRMKVIGRTSLIGKPPVAVGDVIEVKYLYVGADGRLVQPTLLRVRDDKEPGECDTAQLVEGSKRVVAA